MILSVKNVDYLGDYTLLCTFNDGVKKKVDLSSLLKYPAYKELADKRSLCSLDWIKLFFGSMVQTLPLNICTTMARWHNAACLI